MFIAITSLLGISLTVQLFSAISSQTQITTWSTISIKLIDTEIDYTNKLVGLLGNYNGDKGDDITARDGSSVSPNSRTSLIYSKAITCNLNL